MIPGVHGRVLGVLARTESELTMRTVAKLAGVSVNRAVVVLHRLVDLGLVERRDVGAAALVRLDRENEAARAVLSLQDLSTRVVDRLRASAASIQPPPRSLVIFGSFVRSAATENSDLDIIAVRAQETAPDMPQWHDSLGRWGDLAARIAGNPVNLVVVGEDELSGLLRRRGAWSGAREEGVVLAGVPLAEATVS